MGHPEQPDLPNHEPGRMPPGAGLLIAVAIAALFWALIAWALLR